MASRGAQILVPFHGEGSGSGALTWGQLGIWKTMLRTGRTMNIGGTMPLPPGARVEEFTTLLAYVIGRHQSLRTRLEFHDDAMPSQIVASSGEAPLDVVDIDSGDDADAAAEVLRSHYEFTPFDHAVEWPVRMGLIRRDDVLTHFVVQYSHLAVDGFGIEAIIRDMGRMDPATGTASEPISGARPLDIAARQQSPAGRRQSEKSLRYWEAILRTASARRFGDSTDQREPRFWEIVCHSPVMYLAMRAIAARNRVETGHVLLAAQAVALARITGVQPSVAQVLVSNRFRPGFADSVTQLTQPSICSLDVADRTFDAVVAVAWKAATSAYLHGYFDTTEHGAMLDRLAAERGEEVDVSVFINDRRDAEPVSAQDVPSVEQVRAAQSSTEIYWDRKLDTYDGTFYLQVDSAPGAVHFAIWADTHHLSPIEIEAVARELEAIVVEAALDPVAMTGVTAQKVPA